MDLSIDQLRQLTTPRLLALRDSLLKVNEEGDWGNWSCADPGGKQSPKWQAYYARVKQVLGEREHVPKGRRHNRPQAKWGRKGRQVQTR